MSRASIDRAVILAAGSGSRFWPYNVVRQKATFPVANVPAIRRTVDSLAQVGVTRVVVVVGHGEASVRAALRGAEVEIAYVQQPHMSGTAHAAWVGAVGAEGDVLVVHGDVVTAPDNLRAMVDRWSEERPLASTLIQPLGQEPAGSWFVAAADGSRLTRVEGHARSGSHRLCGVYGFRSEALSYLRDNPGVMSRVPVGGMPLLEAEIAQSLQDMIDDGQQVLAVEVEGYHVDLDKPWHILEANHHVIQALSARLEGDQIAPSASVHDGAEVHGRLVLGDGASIGNRVVVQGDLWLAPGARIENGAILQGPIVVGRGTVVRDYCQIGGHTSLGARGVYGHGAEFSGVALDTVYCYHYCEIWGVAGQAVDFGAATVCGNLRFDDRRTPWQVKGRVEVPTVGANATYIGDFSRTGVNAILMPGRRVGVYSCVGAGVILYDDVPDRQLVLVKQELEKRPWGPERYGW